MADLQDRLPTRSAAILLSLIGLGAVGFFVLLGLLNRSPEPLHQRRAAPPPLGPIQQQFNTDSMGQSRPPRVWRPTPSPLPATLPATTQAATLPTTRPGP